MSSSYDKDCCPNCGKTNWDSSCYHGRDDENKEGKSDDETKTKAVLL